MHEEAAGTLDALPPRAMPTRLGPWGEQVGPAKDAGKCAGGSFVRRGLEAPLQASMLFWFDVVNNGQS